MEVLLVLIPLILLIGAVLGIASFLRVKELEVRLKNIERKLHDINFQQSINTGTSKQSDFSSAAVQTPAVSPKTPSSQTTPQTSSGSDWNSQPIKENTPSITPPSQDRTPNKTDTIEKPTIDWATLFQQYWMVILGGICLVFAGIFLVRYSIENGILGPSARFTLGLLFGAGLIIAGEKLRQTNRLEAGVHAALVASGSLIIYSALLVGFHIYELITARTAFACMALMSAFSMLLALKHGPLMAGMGLLGAYLVPILVSTGSKNIEAALLYSFIVTCSSFWLQRHIYRNWLWWGTWAGAIGWFILSLDLPGTAQGIRAFYLAALAYAGVALPFAGLKLNIIDTKDFSDRKVIEQITAVFIALTVAMVLLLHIESFNELSYPAIALLPIVAALVARNNLPALRLLPLITLLPVIIELFSMDFRFHDWKLSIEPMVADLQSSYITLLALLTAAFAAIGGKELFKGRHSGYWASFVLFMPLAAIILAYLRISGMQDGLPWALPTFVIGGTYAYLLTEWRKRMQVVEVEAALAIAAQTAIAVACFFAFSGVTLTLVIALQLISLAYIDRKMPVSVLPIIIKIMLMLVIVRLTFNPWIALYDVSSLTLLITYAGCLASCVIASREVRDRPELIVWLHSASAHLLVLTLAVFTRYVLYDGDIFAKEFNLTESSIYICSLSSVGIIYEWRANYLRSFKQWYRGLALLHIFIAAGLYLFYNMFIHNPLLGLEDISNTPIFNLLIIGYGLPVVLSIIIYKRIDDLKEAAGLISMIGLYMFVTLEIRHLWHDGLRQHMPIKEGELYTYSLVWLILSVAIMIYGAHRNNSNAKKAGVVALLIVIAKAFFWDMRDLDGLWRVVSFLGLGLSLLGVAYLFNRLNTEEKNI